MHSRGFLIAGLVLLAVGVIGMALTSLAVPSGGAPAPRGRLSSGYSSLGQQIYYTGADANGPIPRQIPGVGGMMGGGMAGGPACVTCHGRDGRGGRGRIMMFGTVEVPDIRHSVLASPRASNGTTEPAWTDSEIARAIRDGVEPSGQRLKAPMPRWDMTDADVRAVIDYLKELSAP